MRDLLGIGPFAIATAVLRFLVQKHPRRPRRRLAAVPHVRDRASECAHRIRVDDDVVVALIPAQVAVAQIEHRVREQWAVERSDGVEVGSDRLVGGGRITFDALDIHRRRCENLTYLRPVVGEHHVQVVGRAEHRVDAVHQSRRIGVGHLHQVHDPTDVELRAVRAQLLGRPHVQLRRRQVQRFSTGALHSVCSSTL
jgi:hypothetical protein